MKPPSLSPNKPMEFWIQDEWVGIEGDYKAYVALADNKGFVNPNKSIHVIEYAAYLESQALLEKAVKAADTAMDQWRVHIEENEQDSIQKIRHAEATRWRGCWEELSSIRTTLAEISAAKEGGGDGL